MIKKVYQRNFKDCGVACLLSIIKYYKGENTYENIRYLTKCDNNGVTALNIIEASKKLGFNARGFRCEYEKLKEFVKPLICHIVLKNGYNHFIVLYKINDIGVQVFDPYYGIQNYTKDDFLRIWDNICIELVPFRKLDVLKEENYNIIKKLFLKYKFKYIFITFLSLISIIFTILNNLYFKVLIDGYNTIVILMYFIIIIVFKELIDFVKNKYLINLKNNIDRDLNISMHKKLLSLPNYYFSSRSSGDTLTKFNDLNYIRDLIVEFPVFLMIDILLMGISLYILININLILSIIFLITCILYLIVLLFFNSKIRNKVILTQETNAIKNSILLENINSINTIKNMNIKKYRHKNFFNIFKTYININTKYEEFYNFMNVIKNIVLYIGINVILFKGIMLVNSDTILLSDLIFFESIMIYFIEPLKNICDLNPVLKNGINSIKRANEIYNSKKNKIIYRPISHYNIKFRNLSFSYDGYNKIFNNFNYEIKENLKLFVTGKSGSGKSTLFKLLNKYYEVSNDSITLGNININKVNIPNYITYVSQEETLFNDTIYNNIVLNNKNSNVDDIVDVTLLDKLFIDKSIDLNYIVEENGSNFSKGEKQKIILSRALVKGSRIIILDEALSGVDKHDEYLIMKNILDKFSDKTIIYISHSKTCINLFDEILNFDNKGGNLWNCQKAN